MNLLEDSSNLAVRRRERNDSKTTSDRQQNLATVEGIQRVCPVFNLSDETEMKNIMIFIIM